MKLRIRGLKLKHRVTRLTAIFRFITRPNRTFSGYRRLNPPTSETIKSISRLFSCIKTLCSSGPGRAKDRAVAAPKGQMAVYVGQKDGGFHRFVVPVIYFNHPLFGDLLREAEEEYGFDHPGGITIPCRVSEFERVQTRIAAGKGRRRLLTWKN